MHAGTFAGVMFCLMLSGGSAFAQSDYCDRPRKPSCIDTMALLRDEVTFQTCRSEVERYQRRSSEYQDCLRNEFEDMAAERKKVIDRFNACAQNSYC
ncbi:hypothetical protein ABIB87_004641 [Bradyrhizobium sp. JR18.2]